MRRGKRKSIRNEPYQIPTAADSHEAFFSLEQNKEYLNTKFYHTEDIKFRSLKIQNTPCLLTYLESTR
ncbi:hypothetical protein [Bacillus sp. RAR_GA_16]|uniref:hypothetical protein n=1 Tax=Bacillus sp. RAR_GA_16 TaxID=2876774 RepID=UPI001CCAD72E|nr:hypothetical protein [Bacillus sp. RAR_GA_16]MCA0173358.1 hypothetical protein [Bacillus sp. RAR_GA_16]